MAGAVNKVILVGNLGSDPVIRRTQDGRAIASMSLATSESWRDRNSGDRKEKVEWHKVVIFNESLVKFAEQYLKKGAKVYIEGQLATRKWQDRDGADRYSTEIVLQGYSGSLTMLEGRRDGSRPPAGDADDYGYDSDRAAGRSATSSSGTGSYSQSMDDDIPF